MTDKVTQADRDFAVIVCRLTGWEGVAQRLELGWIPEADTNEGKIVEEAARHRTNTNTELVEALRGLMADIGYRGSDGYYDGVIHANDVERARKALSLYGDER